VISEKVPGLAGFAAIFLFSIFPVGFLSPLQAAIRVPYQRFEWPLACEEAKEGGYFRPEYEELVQRLDPEIMRWLMRTYPVLGWQNMDARVYTPKSIPGTAGGPGLRYDTVRRYMELEALFNFGPLGGNGTLIAELVELDKNRLVTINKGSSNISVIDIEHPDVAGVIPSLRGLKALEFNLQAKELYLVENDALGILIYSLNNYAVKDTLFLKFHPGAVFLSNDTRRLYLTDEQDNSLILIDLSGTEDPLKVKTGLLPPYLLAGDSNSGKIILISTSSGAIRIFDPVSLDALGGSFSIGGRLLSYCAPELASLLYLVSGDCDYSTLYRLSLPEGEQAGLERISSLRGAVKCVVSDPSGAIVHALSGSDVYRLEAAAPESQKRINLPADLRDMAVYGGKVFITGGLRDLFVLDDDLSGPSRRVTLEMGPGPLVIREEKVYVANGLSNSITILDARSLEEDISILVGVLLGRMIYVDQRIVVNNCFRGNVMVLNPDDYIIEDIVPVGGAMDYIPENRQFVFFDDSVVTGMRSPPSKVSIHNTLEMPQGVRLFAPTKDPDVFLVADQERYITRADLKSWFRRGMIPLPAQCRGLFTVGNEAWALAPSELYRFSVSDNIGLSRTYTVRPFKISMPYVASDGFASQRGSIVNIVSRDQLLDIFSTPGEIRVIRQDPDTNYTYIGTSRDVYVLLRGTSRQRSVIPVNDEVDDIYLPAGSNQGYIATREKIAIFDRESLFRRDEINTGGSFVYVSGDELYLRGTKNSRRLIVADGYRAMTYQEISLPVEPTDAASDGERLFLLGGTEGALAIYVNRVDTGRLPRSPDRKVWDTNADRRTGTHR